MQKKEVILSIIIPVYNVEEYLEQCINSILLAEKECIEIILVDDQSTDTSGQICDSFAQKYCNCYSYHNRENKGPGATRNYGVSMARGRFVTFIDADDYVNSEQIKSIICILTENDGIDLYFMNAHKVYRDGSKEPLDQPYERKDLSNKTKEEVLTYLASRQKYPGSACTKIIKREIIVENALSFEEGVLSEDLEWVVKAILYSNTFDCIEGEYYYYRQQRNGSITSHASERRLSGIINAIEKSVKDAEKEDIVARQTINSFMAYEYMIAIWMYDQIKKDISWEKRLKYKSFFEDNLSLLNYQKDKKYHVIKRIIGLVGIDICARALTIVKGKL